MHIAYESRPANLTEPGRWSTVSNNGTGSADIIDAGARRRVSGSVTQQVCLGGIYRTAIYPISISVASLRYIRRPLDFGSPKTMSQEASLRV